MGSEQKDHVDLRIGPGAPDAEWLPPAHLLEIATPPVALETHPDLSPEQHARGLRRLQQAADEERKKDERRAQELQELRSAHQGALRDLLGGEAWTRIRDFRQVLRDQRSRLQFDLRLSDMDESTARTHEWRQESRDRGARLLKKLKVDTRAVQKINRRTRERFDAITADAPPAGDFEARILRNDTVPHEIRTFTTNPWIVRDPPYPGVSYATSGRGLDGFSIERDEVSVQPRSGLFDDLISVYTIRADNFDSSLITHRSRASFSYFTFLRSGRLEMYFKAISFGVRHQYRFEDEWGISSLLGEHELDFEVTVFAPASGLLLTLRHPLSRFRANIDFDPSAGVIGGPVDRLDYGYLDVYWFHARFAAVPANELLRVEFGFRARSKQFANDYSVYASMRSHWALVGVPLRLVSS